MPFDAAQLTAFWIDPDQMGISDRTHQQMATEGLETPNNFEDFAEKSDLATPFKLLLKPAKVPVGPVVAGLLQEVAAFIIVGGEARQVPSRPLITRNLT